MRGSRFLKFLGLFLLTWIWMLLLGFPLTLPTHSLSTSLPSQTQILPSRPPLNSAWTDALALAPPEPSTAPEIENLMQQGRTAYQAGRYQAAIALWHQAATQYQSRGDRLGQVMVTNQMAQAYQALRQWGTAQTTITTSFTLLDQSEASLRWQLLTAQAWNIQGLSLFQQGQLESALAAWQQAVDYYTQARQEVGRLGSLINLAQAQQSLGLYRQAEETLRQVNRHLEQQPDSRLKVLSLLHLGQVLRLTGSLTQLASGSTGSSETVLNAALTIAQRLQDPELLAVTYLNLGTTAWAEQQGEQAIAFYQQAQQTGMDRLTQLQAGLNQLALRLERQEWAIARSLVPALQAQVQETGISHTSLYARLHLAQSLMKLGQVEAIAPTEMLTLLSTTLSAARSLQDRRAESYALGYQGQVYEQLGQWQQAQPYTEQALFIAQSLPAPDIAYQWEWQLGRIFKQQQQRELARVAFAQAYGSLTALRQDLTRINPEMQFNFREQVEPVYRDYIDLLVPSGPPATQQTANPADLIQARQVLESLRLAELTNFLGMSCLQPIALDQVAQSHDAAVIYPILLPDRLAVIVSLPEQLLSYTIEQSSEQVTDVVNRLRQELEKPYTSPQGKKLAQQLEGWLIQPIEATLHNAQIKTLVFVLDGSLRNVPMAALYNGQQYLIERYAVALAPGLSLLTPSALKDRPFKALLVGLTQARDGFTGLTNVAPELQAIQSLLPSQILLDETFTKHNLRSLVQATPFSIVHLATHGQFGSTIDQTFILTWDGRITVNELRTLLQVKRQGIDLLVLSACETAAGDERAALGLAGVAVQSGTRRTLASLWSVDDQSGAVFSRYFYTALVQGGGSSADALRQAQRQLLQDPSYRHPRYWASYVLLGNWL